MESGRIVTFYSFKGGVGRTMALANVAAILAAEKHSVLIVDWDLEAPGLHRYFEECQRTPANDDRGTLGILESLRSAPLTDTTGFESIIELRPTQQYPGGTLTLIAADANRADYRRSLSTHDWERFYTTQDGADRLLSLRDGWKKRFAFTLVDSRTGLSDSSAACVILLSDIVTILFSPNVQCIDGTLMVAKAIRDGRDSLPELIGHIPIIPLLSRVESRVDESIRATWLREFKNVLEKVGRDWLPSSFPTLRLAERLRIPYFPALAFGESLAVLTSSRTDPDGIGFYFYNIARVISNDMDEMTLQSVCDIEAFGQPRDVPLNTRTIAADCDVLVIYPFDSAGCANRLATSTEAIGISTKALEISSDMIADGSVYRNFITIAPPPKILVAVIGRIPYGDENTAIGQTILSFIKSVRAETQVVVARAPGCRDGDIPGFLRSNLAIDVGPRLFSNAARKLADLVFPDSITLRRQVRIISRDMTIFGTLLIIVAGAAMAISVYSGAVTRQIITLCAATCLSSAAATTVATLFQLNRLPTPRSIGTTDSANSEAIIHLKVSNDQP